VTDPLSDQPMTEADIRAMLAWGEKWDLTDTTALARECLRLRALLAEAAGALRGFAEYARARDQYPGWAACPDHSLLALSDGYGGGPMHAKITVGDCRQAAATAARVRGHLGGKG
jgi:hypothetical protein